MMSMSPFGVAIPLFVSDVGDPADRHRADRKVARRHYGLKITGRRAVGNIFHFPKPNRKRTGLSILIWKDEY